MPEIFDILEQRGFLNDCTDPEGFREATSKGSVTVYAGFDPTAESLQIGNMVPIMGLMHFQRAGHRPIIIVGGATGMIGDPGGKSEERNLLDLDQVARNVASQRKQFELFLDFEGPQGAKIFNNLDWLGSMSFIEFLRDVGKNFRVGEMLGKESVRSRLNSEAGISYTEFSYMLLQAYDFKHLMETEDCSVQCGGREQWGNITAGVELIRRTLGKQAFGLTFPLITTSDGKKLGKSEAGAVWLDPNRTSPFDFYQYWVRTDDRDVERFLKLFTIVELNEIAELMREHEADPGARIPHKRLALETTRMVHGDDEARKAREAAEALYSTSLKDLTDDRLHELFPDVPSVQVGGGELDAGIAMPDMLVRAGLAGGKKEAKRLIAQGGVYVNDEPWDPASNGLSRRHLASESMILLRAGKKRYCLVKISD